MQNYLVKLLFNINIDDGNDRSQFDEQVRLVKSFSPEEAFFKARSIGRDEESTFLNAENKPVTWQFVDVLELYAMHNLEDGQILYTRSKKEEDHQTYITFIKQKAMELQTKNLSYV
jgi:hypothetical protein